MAGGAVDEAILWRILQVAHSSQSLVDGTRVDHDAFVVIR
jgi:hypothetical protein